MARNQCFMRRLRSVLGVRYRTCITEIGHLVNWLRNICGCKTNTYSSARSSPLRQGIKFVMDKPISQQVIIKRRRRRAMRMLGVVFLLAAGWWLGGRALAPKIEEGNVVISVVEQGDVLQTLTASGTVVPAFEYTINAPVVSEVRQIHKRSGTLVAPDELILDLDQEYTQLEFDKLSDELMLRRNSIGLLKLEFEKALDELELQNAIKDLQIAETEAQIASQTRLLKLGGASAEDLEKAELQLEVMRIEKRVLENDLAYKRQKNTLEQRNLELEFAIQEKRLTELERKLSETSVRADRGGVITWMNAKLGTTVQQGEPLVRIANLEEFSIEAVTSDRNLDHLNTGTAVVVRINQEKLKGVITQTLPTVENNSVRFLVALEDPSHPALRPNQRAEVFIVTDEALNTLRLRMGPAISAAASQEVFVVQNGNARKVAITKGLNNPDYVEIRSGLALGDRVIISDTKDLLKHSSIKVKP